MAVHRPLPPAVRALPAVARERPGPVPTGPRADRAAAPCPTPFDLVEHMRRASGRAEREEAARLVRVLLREAGADPFVCRMLVQALLPGLVAVAGKLRWGQGGEWQDGEEFFGGAALDDVARRPGVGRAGPALCRPRPPVGHPLPPAAPAVPRQGPGRRSRRRSIPTSPRSGPRRAETDLEELARILIDLHREGMRRRRGRGPLRPPRPRLHHRRAGRHDRSGPPRALRPPGPRPAATLRLSRAGADGVTRAYGVPVAGGGPDTTEATARAGGSGPTQLVGDPRRVAGPHGTPRGDRRSAHRDAAARAAARPRRPSTTSARPAPPPLRGRDVGPTTTTDDAPRRRRAHGSATVHRARHVGPPRRRRVRAPGDRRTARRPSPTTTTTLPPATTTTTSRRPRRTAGRPHADPGLPRPAAAAVERVRVHRDRRDAGLGALVRDAPT